MTDIPKIFGSMVFNREVMRQRLSSDVYERLIDVIENGGEMEKDVADAVAEAMKEWAIEKGATHYTHWFQPMTGITAEKHDSFLTPTRDGGVVMEFSGKKLIKGEPDASSFPSGGLRATFEARGYTAWDPTSYAFVKDGSLCIPTVFCSYGGEVLDKKTPLMRSTEAVCKQSLRILRLFGDTETKRVFVTAGAEQEYFLIDRARFEKREDLVITGRTLFGSKPPKGQEMEDHYFGALRPRVSEFMHDLDTELWKLGVYAKTKHNEVAPGQHELAPGYSNVNLATDHNQLTMEIMKKVAERHGLACLLHEKPFRGVNGSGKHNNWALSTDTGKNLLKPGREPESNKQFLLFMCAVIKAVDEHQDLLRISVSTAGNDRRLGGAEAPPAIISMFLGEDITRILESIAEGHNAVHNDGSRMDTGVAAVPEFWKDKTDRNRTSPFAFTGNKFEFRMPGSSQNLSDADTVLNTAVAKSLHDYADELEGAKDFESAVIALIKRTIHDHRRVIFNGDGYTEAWEKEAERRGLPNAKYTPLAMKALLADKNIRLMEQFGVLTKTEMHSRYEVEIEHYSKVINIEALTMLEMLRKQIMPAVAGYSSEVASAAAAKQAVSDKLSVRSETRLLEKLSAGADELSDAIDALQESVDKATAESDEPAKSYLYHDAVLPAMEKARKASDTLERICSEDYWPLPSYSRMLYYV